MDDNIITNTDFINPNNKEVTCSIDAEIEVYRDSDYVYCHKVKVDALKCLSEDYRDKLAEDQKTNDPYAIDTCVWK